MIDLMILIDLLICLADYGSYKSYDHLVTFINVTQEGWQSPVTKIIPNTIYVRLNELINWFYDFYDFCDF